MKKSMLIKNQGFSLVELMVVVAIIGILASVAVPQYAKFQAKARQTEAKVLLASVVTAEKTFFVETNGYSTCLRSMGVFPTLNGTLNAGYYAFGFADAQAVPPNTATTQAGIAASPPNGTACQPGAGEHRWDARQNASNPSAAAGATSVAFPVGSAMTNAATPTFVAVAAGFVSNDSARNTNVACDAWTVNQNSNFVNIRNGI